MRLAAAAGLLLFLVAGCDATIGRDALLGDPQDLRDYALGQTEQSVTQHLRSRPVARQKEPSGGEVVTWRLKDGRTVIGAFDNQGGLIEVRFGHDAAGGKPAAK